ncbi:MAG: cardiolipin synthase [Schleiferiaceae bacterium]
MDSIENGLHIDPWVLITGTYYVIAILVALGILLENRNPPKTIAYLLMLFLFPFAGLIVYVLFGQNFRKRKLFSRKGLKDNEKVAEFTSDTLRMIEAIEPELESFLGQQLKTAKALMKNENALLSLNNKVTVLRNGEEKFPAVYEALLEAKHHIHLDYYIIESDPVGKRLFEILAQKAQEGVEVRVIFDDVGSRSFSGRDIRKLRASGAILVPFMPVIFPSFTSKANYRDHRKIVVVDGNVGFVGGINMSNRYQNIGDGSLYWRDTHLRLEGDSVKGLQLAFFLNWQFVHGEYLPIETEYFPPSEPADLTLTQVATSGPDSDWAGIMHGFFAAINNAMDYVYITTPYFIPNEALSTALQSAALAGVDVRVLIPKKADSKITQAASLSFVKPLLKAGVRVFLYEKGFVHAKTMVVDDRLSTVGTANFDNRSFDINFEVNAFVYDPDIALEIKGHFLEDLEDSEEIDLARWSKRNIGARILESLARLIAPLL